MTLPKVSLSREHLLFDLCVPTPVLEGKRHKEKFLTLKSNE